MAGRVRGSWEIPASAPGVISIRERDAGFGDLPAGRDLQVAVGREPRLVAAAGRAERLLGRHVSDAAIRQLDGET